MAAPFHGTLDHRCPINWSWPGNRGLLGWWAGWPLPGWSGGLTLRNAVLHSGRGSTTGGGHGTLNNFAAPFTSSSGWVAGPNGLRGLAFDGVDDYVSYTPPASLTDFTVSAWIKPTSLVNDASTYWWENFPSSPRNCVGFTPSPNVAGNGAQWECVVGGTGSQVRDSGPLTVGVWYHVVFTRAGTVGTGYINARSIGTMTVGSGSFSPANGRIGDHFFSGVENQPLNATIGDDRLYSNALSASEVWSLYDQSRRGHPDALRWIRGTSYFFGFQAGGTLFTRTATDNPATTDAVTRAFTGARTASDSPLTTDALARLFTGTRTANDNPAAADAPVRTLSLPRTASDNPATTDTTVRTLTGTRTVTDNPRTTDSPVRASTAGRSASDSPLTTDAATRVLTAQRTATDSPATVESVDALSGKLVTATDGPATTDAVTRVLVAARTASDSPLTSDAAARLFTGARTASDGPFTYGLPDATWPAAYYRFDGSLKDSSGNGNDLTGSGVTYGSGVLGQAMTAGTSSVAHTPGTDLTTTDVSISCWFFASAGNAGVYHAGASVGWANFALSYVAQSGGGGSVVPKLSGLVFSLGGTYRLVDGQWNHVAHTWNHTTQTWTLYVNGVQVDTKVHSALTTAFGSLAVNAVTTFASSVDEVGVYARCLAAADVAALYNGGAGYDPTQDTLVRTYLPARSVSDAPQTSDVLARIWSGSRTLVDSPFTTDALAAAATRQYVMPLRGRVSLVSITAGALAVTPSTAGRVLITPATAGTFTIYPR